MPIACATPPGSESVRSVARPRAAEEASGPRIAASFTEQVWSRCSRGSRASPSPAPPTASPAGQGQGTGADPCHGPGRAPPTVRRRNAGDPAAGQRQGWPCRSTTGRWRRSRRSIRVAAAAGEPLDLDRDAGDHAVVGGRAGEADGDGDQQLEVPAGLPNELGDRIVGRLALLRLPRPFEGEEPLAPWIEERDVVLELVLRLRPPADPAPPPGEAQLAVHVAEPLAEREVRLEGDSTGAEHLPGAGREIDGEPDIERERASAEVEDGVVEPELEILEAVHRGPARGIAQAVREPDDRLQAIGYAVLEVRTDGRAPLVRKAEMTRRERGLELVLVLDVDRAGDRELLREDRHPLRTARRRREQQSKADDASCDRGRPRGDHRAAGTVLRRGRMPPLTKPPPGRPVPRPRSARRRRSASGRASESRPTAPSAGPRGARRPSARPWRSRGHAAPPARGS